MRFNQTHQCELFFRGCLDEAGEIYATTAHKRQRVISEYEVGLPHIEMLAQSKRPHQRQFNYLTILQTESPSSICSMPTLCPSRLRRICRCRFWSQRGERRVCNLACAGTPMCDPSTGTFQPAGHSFVQAGFCVW